MKSLKRSLFLLTALLVLPTLVVACGDDDDDDEEVIEPFELTYDVDASTVGSVVGLTFSFSDLSSVHPSLAGPTDVTFDSETRISFSNGGATASGDLTFGSCVITVTNSDITTLTVGAEFTINPCQITFQLANAIGLGTLGDGQAGFAFGAVVSDPANVTVQITPGGTITINGTPVGNVSEITGSSGGGS